MSQRALIAAEMQHLLEQLQQHIEACERLAKASGMVDPKHFRAMQTSVMLAAGDLDQKGLLIRQSVAAVIEQESPA